MSLARQAGRIALGAFMVGAGTLHLTTLRREFQAQVPGWFPVDADLVVLASGVVEVALGSALLGWRSRRVQVGWLTAAFFVVIFPGNISQYVNRIDGFGLDSDQARLVRLFLQPLFVAWALWSTGAWATWRARRREARPRDRAM